MQPGMSMATVAMAHGVNANLLRRWVREAELRPLGMALGKPATCDMEAPEAKPSFVPVGLPLPAAAAPVADIRIELQRGATAITVTRPTSAATRSARSSHGRWGARPGCSWAVNLPGNARP